MSLKNAITYEKFNIELKSYLKSHSDLEGFDVRLGLTVRDIGNLLRKKTIVIAQRSAPKEEIGDEVYNRDLTFDIYVFMKSARLYDDAGILTFLKWIDRVENALEGERFMNEIMKAEIELEDTDVSHLGEQIFLFGAILTYVATVKGG